MSSFYLSPALQKDRVAELPEAKKKELGKLKNACSDFESIFMHQMLKEMRKTVNKTGMINGGQAEEIFADMLDQERAKTMSIGLGDILYMQLSRGIVPPKSR
ncbi:MAG: rod-binding protein [Candidatus Riflebacteria bacterium]|nr:rod-binding protein [Candidatus Riflebacteria bacterium]